MVVVDLDGVQPLSGLILRTITDRRRCRSIPTIYAPSYSADMWASFVV
jgi:hypothetical protein